MDRLLTATFIVVVLAVAFITVTAIATPSGQRLAPAARSPIRHVIIIFQENHAFDNYFGTYPGADGIPNGTCVPYNISQLSGRCLSPWLNTNAVDTGSVHAWNNSFIAYDYGRMDGFVQASAGTKSSMSYYDNRTIPYYWQLAGQYVLTDHLFSSALSYSTPNHWFAIAARTPAAGFDYVITRNTSTYVRNEYLNQSSRIGTIGDLLNKANITWEYYDRPLTAGGFAAAVNDFSAFDFWNPFAAKNSSYNQSMAVHFVPRVSLFTDLIGGTLPQVSWVIPPFDLSEHPPANITLGMWYVTYIVDSVMQSKYWNSTMIIVMWDDYGGYYDNVKPQAIDQFGYGFRVPGIIISPYAKQGYVDHTNYSFGSTLKFIEWNYNLPNLFYRDQQANNLLNAFDFAQNPRRPYVIPLNQSQIQQVASIMQSQANTYFEGGNSTIIVNGFGEKAYYFET